METSQKSVGTKNTELISPLITPIIVLCSTYFHNETTYFWEIIGFYCRIKWIFFAKYTRVVFGKVGNDDLIIETLEP